MDYRLATLEDVPLLARLNKELAVDERYRKADMPLAEFVERMRRFLLGDYQAVIFEQAGQVTAYAIFRDDGESVHLRQLFVSRRCRRQGVGRQVVETLRRCFWPADEPIVTDVLCHNTDALAFYRAVGFTPHTTTLTLPPRSDTDPPTDSKI